MKQLSVMLDPGAYMPVRAHYDDAGLDLRTPVDVIIPQGRCAVIDTGVHVALPANTFGKLESKSGLNVQHSVVCLGGVIDAGYTGSIKVKLYNFGDEDYQFKAGDKVVQMIIQSCVIPDDMIVKDNLAKTERGANGFGSSGK